jgi:membrane peptidoglycan carboxypeptidase
LRALWDDLRAWRLVEGGSTITEQLAKNAYLHDDDHTPWLKWQDIILALKVEQRYTKQKILELYLNLVYFGDGAVGIGAAAQHYFGIAPARLDLAQASLLVGLVRAPSFYDPFCNPLAALSRQQFVLNQMMADGMISPAQAQAATRESATFWPDGPRAGDPFCNG